MSFPHTAEFKESSQRVSDGDHHRISEEIEQLRVLFEKNWGLPSAPSIEQLLEEVSATSRASLLRELLYVEFELTQRKNGELQLDPYLIRFSEHEEIVREVAHAVAQYAAFKRWSVDGYTLLGEIGRGGMGTVYRAKSDLLNNFVAFKMINPRLAENSELLQRFLQELQVIGRLKHQNIVEAKHVGITAEGTPYLVMELIDGVTLQQWNKLNPPPETDSRSTLSKKTSKPAKSDRIVRICEIVREVASGLQAIHDAKLVHRDIKPGNIMLLSDGRVKILDLGLAKLRERISDNSWNVSPQTQQGDFIGTPGFMAPEQMHSAAHVDIRADIYSLGCTFFFLLYGRAPTATQPTDQPTECQASVLDKLRKILDRMLAADPAARFQEPCEVVAALDSFLNPPKSFRFGKLTAVALVAIFACVVLAFYASSFDDRHDKPSFVEEQNQPVDNAVVTQDAVQSAIDLRWRGDSEQALSMLRPLENELRTQRLFDGSDKLLAEVLSGQGDCLFFSGLASNALPTKTVKRLKDWYEEALKLTDESSPHLRAKLLCKLAVIEKLHGTAGTSHPTDIEQNDDPGVALYFQFAEAVTVSNGEDQPLRNFAEQFELGTEPELSTREALDLRLFALEHLIDRDMKANRDTLTKDLRLLDSILLMPYPDADSCVYLNRFFDLAIRVCDPNDYGQLVKYLSRLRPQGTAGTRPSLPSGATFVLLYFSPWSDADGHETKGFAIYYPAERQNSERFPLPWTREAVSKAIKEGKSLDLDEKLVSLIHRDIGVGIPIVLSWDDTRCWPLRRDAFATEDWPFDSSITVDEILGQMK